MLRIVLRLAGTSGANHENEFSLRRLGVIAVLATDCVLDFVFCVGLLPPDAVVNFAGADLCPPD